MTEIISQKELNIHCPYYLKNIKSCPSAKKILFPEDMERLEGCCLSETYSSCSIYRELIEKAA
ncbi:MAG TPA: hypothetical protein PK079_03920 [Leptospiraceae bacterium]|nr:hypothetical protein [Leptospiraceae bacterium]HMW03561.1 hypothetical protein [Leptospiraceae bacterium]HMX35009.1 hypothetical protein [Leptospiraceae bacterium]HMY29518.1 hypothetical protein [Leptospiraceae bacterium]HMZ63561.1 hypothetical protein [Leptospiraceae bacterium]